MLVCWCVAVLLSYVLYLYLAVTRIVAAVERAAPMPQAAERAVAAEAAQGWRGLWKFVRIVADVGSGAKA